MYVKQTQQTCPASLLKMVKCIKIAFSSILLATVVKLKIIFVFFLLGVATVFQILLGTSPMRILVMIPSLLFFCSGNFA